MWLIVFQIVPVVAWCIAYLVVVRPLALRSRLSAVVSVLLALAFGKFAFFALVGGHGFNPDLPPIAIWLYGWAYAAAMMLTGASFLLLLADGALWMCHHRVGTRTRRIRTAVVAAAAAALSAWGVYEGVRTPEIHRVEVAFHGLPPAFDGYRIVHLSDLHCSTAARRERFERIVEAVNSLDADLVAITGDFVDGSVADRLSDLKPLSRLKAKDGVYGCAGNHERYWDWPGWRDALLRWRVHVLPGLPGSSPFEVIRRGEEALAIGGMMDPAFYGRHVPDARAVFCEAPKGAFRILLFHRPYTEASMSAEAEVGLQLSGHTHGGAMPVLDWLVAMANEGRTRGLYEFGEGRYIHVSPGTGQWAGFPLRLFNPAEITELTLRSLERLHSPPDFGRIPAKAEKVDFSVHQS